MALPDLPGENENPWFAKRDAFDTAVRQAIDTDLPASINDVLTQVGLAINAIRLYGTGSPVGNQNDAPIGTLYVDAINTNGALLWIKTANAGFDGWKVLSGDTGWRDLSGTPITTLLPTTPTWALTSGGGKPLLRRVNSTVTLLLDITATATAYGEGVNWRSSATWFTPFEPFPATIQSEIANAFTSGATALARIGALQVGANAKFRWNWTSAGRCNVALTWVTPQPWPTSALPGAASA